MTEVQKYEVVKSYKEFEVRAYAPFITVSTHESGTCADTLLTLPTTYSV